MSAVTFFTPAAAAHSAGEVHRRLREALRELRDAERNAVLWFAEILRRRLYRDLGYGTIHQYAADALGFSPARTSQFIRLASSLEDLPELKRAVTAGEIPWTKAREVARVATPETESRWIATAKGESRRALEARIQALRGAGRDARSRDRTQAALPLAQGPDMPEGAPEAFSTIVPGPAGATVDGTGRSGAPVGTTNPGTTVATTAPGATVAAVAPPTADCSEVRPAELPVHHQLRFTPAQEARWAALVERLRKLRRREPREDLVLAALEALVRETEGTRRGGGAASSAHTVDTERRPGVLGPEEETGPAGGPTPAAADAASLRGEARQGTAADFPQGKSRPTHRVILLHCPRCGATEGPSRSGGRPVAPAELRAALCDGEIVEPSRRLRSAIPPRLRAAALARDRHRCRTPGCGGTAFLEVHHVVPRAQGGRNRLDNLITLCSGCHGAVHRQEHRQPRPEDGPGVSRRTSPRPKETARGSDAGAQAASGRCESRSPGRTR